MVNSLDIFNWLGKISLGEHFVWENVSNIPWGGISHVDHIVYLFWYWYKIFIKEYFIGKVFKTCHGYDKELLGILIFWSTFIEYYEGHFIAYCLYIVFILLLCLKYFLTNLLRLCQGWPFYYKFFNEHLHSSIDT